MKKIPGDIGLDREQASAYRRRWEALSEFEREELRRMTLDEKLEALDRLSAFAKWAGRGKTPPEDDEPVPANWRKLREMACDGQ